MQLAFAFFADAAQVGADGKFTIMGGDFDTIFALSFPALHPNLAVVLRLNLSPNEVGIEHRLRIVLTGPLGSSVIPAPLTGTFTSQIPADHKAGRAIRAAFVVNVANLVFQTEGTYRFRITVDDKTLGELQLHVARTSNPASISLN